MADSIDKLIKIHEDDTKHMGEMLRQIAARDALLRYAVNNEKDFTENDPDGTKRHWIEQAKIVLKEGGK